MSVKLYIMNIFSILMLIIGGYIIKVKRRVYTYLKIKELKLSINKYFIEIKNHFHFGDEEHIYNYLLYKCF